MKVYISLPITGKDLSEQKALAEKVADELRGKGHEPINPFDSDKEGMTYGEYLGKDIKLIIDNSDAVIFCNGWMQSRGCAIEWYCAALYGKSIAFYPDFIFISKAHQWHRT